MYPLTTLVLVSPSLTLLSSHRLQTDPQPNPLSVCLSVVAKLLWNLGWLLACKDQL